MGPCLLVDTGAFQNIAGSYWVSRVEEILKQEGQPPIEWSKLDNPHPVSGVGKDIVYAKWNAKIPIKFPGGGRTTYNCLYMENSKCPGLLGMQSLNQTGSILDLRAGELYMYSGDTANVRIDIPQGERRDENEVGTVLHRTYSDSVCAVWRPEHNFQIILTNPCGHTT